MTPRIDLCLAGRALRRALSAVLVVIGASSSSALAQAPSASRPMLTFEHDGRNVTGFVLYATPEGGVPLAFELGPLRPDAAGRVTVPVPQLPAGAYLLEVAAYNRSGESPRTTAVPPKLVVKAAPAAAPAATGTDQPPAKASDQPAANTSGGEQKRGGGAFGKFWRVVIGSDE